MTVSNITILIIISMLFYSCSALTILFYVLDRTDNFYKKIDKQNILEYIKIRKIRINRERNLYNSD